MVFATGIKEFEIVLTINALSDKVYVIFCTPQIRNESGMHAIASFKLIVNKSEWDESNFKTIFQKNFVSCAITETESKVG